MAITQPTLSEIGAYSTELATNAAAKGNFDTRVANALVTLAAETKVDTEANAAAIAAVTSGTITGILPAANVVQQVRAARGVVVANVSDLAAFTVADASGVNDGLTYSVGQTVLLVNQTTPTQDGPYVVGTVASTTAPLTRPSWWAAASAQPAAVVFEINEGTWYASSEWKATVAGAVTVGTTSPAFYPRTWRQQVALASGTYTIGFGSTATPDEPLFLLSTTRSTAQCGRKAAGGTLTGTVQYNAPGASLVAGKAGTAVVVVQAQVEAGTIQNQDTSTLYVTIVNW